MSAIGHPTGHVTSMPPIGQRPPPSDTESRSAGQAIGHATGPIGHGSDRTRPPLYKEGVGGPWPGAADDLSRLSPRRRAAVTLRQVPTGAGPCWEDRAATPARHHRGRTREYWELLVGPIGPGLVLHHKCANPGCVRPGHLEMLTRAEHRARHAAGRNGSGDRQALEWLVRHRHLWETGVRSMQAVSYDHRAGRTCPSCP